MAARGVRVLVLEREQEFRERLQARLVAGCDGRFSVARTWGKFNLHKDPDYLTIAGVLLEGGSGYRQDTGYFFPNPVVSLAAVVAPQADGRLRCCLMHRCDDDRRLHGHAALPRFDEDSIEGVLAGLVCELQRRWPIGQL
jgi:2-polyprenyl-6-methoxyphenol hydroxylase-like FAD-dependent oxidoreductase